MTGNRIYPILFRYAFLAIPITLPLNIYANSISIILFSAAWLLEGNFSRKIKLFPQRPLIIVFILFYLLFLAGVLYSANMPEARFNLEKKLSLLVLPLLIGTSVSLDEKLKENALWAFVASCFMACLVCLGYGLYRYYCSGHSTFLFYMDLASPVKSHAIYLAMYLAFSIFILIHFLNKYGENYSLQKKRAIVFLILFFICFIFLLTARMTLAFMVFYFSFQFLSWSYRKKRLLIGILTVLIVAAIAAIITSRIDFFRMRFMQLLESDLSAPPAGENANGLTVRLVKWRCSIEGIIEHPLTGTGTGDAVDYLVECYKEKNFWGMYDAYRFNSHNQYLQTALTLGLPGLLCFLLILFVPLIKAFRERNYLPLSFLGLFCFCCLTESILERHQGIVFFTFFISILSSLSFSNTP